MTAQPSPEAVALVQAVIRAERECVVEEEQNGFTSPSHWALIGKLDATTEALFAYVVKLEADKARLDWLEEQGEVYGKVIDYDCMHAFEWNKQDGALCDAIDASRGVTA